MKNLHIFTLAAFSLLVGNAAADTTSNSDACEEAAANTAKETAEGANEENSVRKDEPYVEAMTRFNAGERMVLKLDFSQCHPTPNHTEIINWEDKGYQWKSISIDSSSSTIVQASQDDGSPDTLAFLNTVSFSAPKDYETMSLYGVTHNTSLVIHHKGIWYSVERKEVYPENRNTVVKYSLYNCPPEALEILPRN